MRSLREVSCVPILAASCLAAPYLAARRLAALANIASIFVGAIVGMASIGTASPAMAQGASSAVELDIRTEPGLPVGAAQEWLAALKDLKLSGLRISQASAGDEPKVEEQKIGRSVSYQVTGILTARGTLRLPGGTFTRDDVRRIGQWVNKLQAGGTESLSEKPGAFGLTSKQLVTLHEKLATPVAISTAGKPAVDTLRKLMAAARVPVTIDPAAAKSVPFDDVIADELEGVSIGTALAAAVRPFGLVVVPERAGADVKLRIVDSRSAQQSWPVGWPTDKNTDETAPQLLKFIDVEIADTPLNEALAVVQKRLQVPMLLDHNGLARQRIDPAEAKVTVPKTKTFYAKILDRLLSQLRLKWEVRLDEAERPIIWISSRIE